MGRVILCPNCKSTLNEDILKQRNSENTCLVCGGSGSSGKDKGSGTGGDAGGLVGAIEDIKSATDKALGGSSGEGGTGDGSKGGGTGAIGQFEQLKTAVDDVSASIGSEGIEGAEGENSDTLIGSIDDLGTSVTDTLGKSGGDGIIGKFEEFRDVIKEAAGHVSSIYQGLIDIDKQNVECTITINVKLNGSIPAFASGTVLGNMQIESATYNAKYGKAFANGTIGLPKAEKNALVSEYGQTEMTVLPDGKTIVTDTPTMMNLPKDTVIYNEEQTKKILSNKIDVNGTAHADGTTDDEWITLPNGERVRELRPGDRVYELQKKFEPLLKRIDGNLDILTVNARARYEKDMTELEKHVTNNVNNVTNNRNVQPVVNNINVTCPGVTEQQVAERLGSVLDKELDKKFSGFYNYTDQMSRIR